VHTVSCSLLLDTVIAQNKMQACYASPSKHTLVFCFVCCCTVATCQDIAFCLQSPAEIIDFDVVAEAFPGDLEDGTAPEDVYVHVPNPMFDYVPPELISLFVTDTGGYTPSYIYRLLAEYYTREDYDLNSKAVHALSR